MRGRSLTYFTGYILFTVLIFACAKQSSPAGGPIDEQPPVVLSTLPPAGTVNFSGNSFEVTFDEYFVLQGVDQKLLISPPLQKKPEIKIRKKSLVVTFAEELRDSATYTFYFQDAVQDLNEGNPIQNFQYVFSTGPVLDSLTVYGTIYNAFDLQPGEDVFVVLYSGTSDTLPATTIPTYMTRADADGSFRIDNLAGGVYTMYGLKDMNNNKIYDLPDESFAFLDKALSLTAETHYIPVADTTVALPDSLTFHESPGSIFIVGESPDSVLVGRESPDSILIFGESPDSVLVGRESPDSILIFGESPDSILVGRESPDTILIGRDDYPDDIDDTIQGDTITDHSAIHNVDKEYSLYFFTAAAERLYLMRSDRSKPYNLTFVFSMPVDSGKFNISFPESPGTDYITRVSAVRDTFNIWLTDSLVYSQPVIPVVINYPAVDSAGADITAIDTLRLRYVQPARGRGTRAAEEKGIRITVSPAPGKGLPPGSEIVFRAETPVAATDTSRIFLKQVSDTLLKDVSYTFKEDTVKLGRFILNAGLHQDSSYLLIYDRGSFTDIYNHTNDSATYRFKVRNEESFGNLILRLSGFQGNMIIQLLSTDEKVLREQSVTLPEENRISFALLEPGEYRLKAVYDINGDGKWSTGNWERRLKPEPVTYYPDPVSLKALWTIEQDWDLSRIYFKSENMRNPAKQGAAGTGSSTGANPASSGGNRTPVPPAGRSGAIKR